MAMNDVIVRVDADVSSFAKKLDKSQAKLVQFGKAVSVMGASVAGAFASMSVASAAAIGTSVSKASEFEDAFTSVKKTINGTEADYDKLSKGILEMSRHMPQSAADIAEVAAEAGRLGIKKNDILKFTKTMVMMGDASNMSSTQAAQSLARFMNIMGTSQSDVQRLGSVITDLGNNTATSESEIIQLGLRLAGAAKQAGMAESDVMAVAASMSELGIRAEAGGSAMSRVILDINSAVMKGGKEVEGFAKVAGVSGSEFKKAFEKDATKAIQMFITGLGKMSEEGKDVASVLDDLGLGELRVRDTLLRLSSAHLKFGKNIKEGSKAWKENKALVQEAEKRYATFSSKLKMLRNRLNRILIIIGTPMMAVLSDMLDALNPLINVVESLASWFLNLDKKTQKMIASILVGVSVITALAAAFFAALSGIGFLIIGLDALAGALGIGIGALVVFAGQIALIGTAVVAAIAGIVALTVAVVKNWDKIISATSKMVKSISNGFKKFVGIVTDTSKTIPEKLAQLKKSFAKSFDEIATTVGNFTTDISSKLLDLIPEPVVNAVNSGIDAIKSGLQRMADAGYPIQDVMKNLSGIFVALGLSLLGVSGPLGILIGSLVFLATKTDIVSDMFKVFKGEMSFENAIGNMTEMVNKFVNGFGDMAVAALDAGSDIIVNLIQGLTDALPKIANSAVRIINTVLDTIAEVLPQLVAAGVRIIENVAKGIANMLPQLVAVGLEVLMELIGAIVSALPQIVAVGSQILTTLVGAITEMLPILVDAGLQILDALISAITELLPVLIDVGVEILTTLIEGIVSVLPTLIEVGLQILTTLIGAIIIILPQLLELGMEMLDTLINGIIQVVPKLIETGMELILALTDALIGLLPELLKVGIELLLALINGILEALPQLLDTAGDLVVKIGDAIGKMLPTIIDAGIKVLNALIDGIVKILPKLLTTGTKLIVKLVGAILKLLPKLLAAGVKLLVSLITGLLNTMGQLMATGGELIRNFISSMLGMAGNVLSAGADLGMKAITGVKNKFGSMLSAGKGIAKKAISGIKSLYSSAKSTAKTLGGKAVSGVKGVYGKMKSAGSHIISGMIGGIKSMGKSAIESITGVVGGVVSKAKSLLKIKSPSRVFKQIGAYTGEGMVIGMDGQVRSVSRMADKMANAAIPDQPKLAKFDVNEFEGQARTFSTRIKAEASGFNVERDSEVSLLGDIRDELRRQKQMIIQLNDREVGRAVEPAVSEIQERTARFKKSFK